MKSKFATLFLVYLAILMVVVALYEIKLINMQNKYKQKHDVSTDQEIENYEFIFNIKCTKECYH